jgi:hypothetical protein
MALFLIFYCKIVIKKPFALGKRLFYDYLTI